MNHSEAVKALKATCDVKYRNAKRSELSYADMFVEGKSYKMFTNKNSEDFIVIVNLVSYDENTPDYYVFSLNNTLYFLNHEMMMSHVESFKVKKMYNKYYFTISGSFVKNHSEFSQKL